MTCVKRVYHVPTSGRDDICSAEWLLGEHLNTLTFSSGFGGDEHEIRDTIGFVYTIDGTLFFAAELFLLSAVDCRLSPNFRKFDGNDHQSKRFGKDFEEPRWQGGNPCRADRPTLGKSEVLEANPWSPILQLTIIDIIYHYNEFAIDRFECAAVGES